MKILEKILLSQFTSMRVGGPAEYFCEPESIDDIKKAVVFTEKQKLPFVIMSGGTNIIFSDEGYRGLVINLGKFKNIQSSVKESRFVIEAWSGTPKSLLLKEFLKQNLAPAMFLAGLPGDVGGGVVMNAGVGENLNPKEFVEIVDWVEVLRGTEIIRINSQELKWTYRGCEGWQPGIIINVQMSWPNSPDPSVREKVRELNKLRIEKQPLEYPNTGSVFKNPNGDKAGRLIDQCGLKGFSIGDAQVSEKHANFIINRGKATSTDIKKLVEHIQSVVKNEKGIILHPEWIFLGF